MVQVGITVDGDGEGASYLCQPLVQRTGFASIFFQSHHLEPGVIQFRQFAGGRVGRTVVDDDDCHGAGVILQGNAVDCVDNVLGVGVVVESVFVFDRMPCGRFSLGTRQTQAAMPQWRLFKIR